jgi:hypothetical protein
MLSKESVKARLVHMTDPVSPDRIRDFIRKLVERLPADDSGMLDAVVAVLLAFRDVPREHHARLFDIMRAFADISKEQQTLLVRITDEDFRSPALSANAPPTS